MSCHSRVPGAGILAAASSASGLLAGPLLHAQVDALFELLVPQQVVRPVEVELLTTATCMVPS